jgi:integrating conjugative element protein (TIGR03765 family)
MWAFKLNFLLVLGLMSSAIAAPIVIKDYGGRDSGVPTQEVVMREYQKHAPVASHVNFNPYPIVSKVQAGKLDAPIRLRVPVVKPLFFLGNDALSRQWVDKNKQYLLSIRASGYATNLQNEDELLALREWAKPLGIAPMPLDQAAQVFGIPVYPVLIYQETVKQ